MRKTPARTSPDRENPLCVWNALTLIESPFLRGKELPPPVAVFRNGRAFSIQNLAAYGKKFVLIGKS